MIKINRLVVYITLLLIIGCSQHKDYTQYVDPFIGTGAHGHTYPGASLPFGMVQLSPDTRNDDSWDGCGGYHYSDSSIIGFSHTHLSGVGVTDYGDVLFLPFTGDIPLKSGTSKNPESGYRSRFSHNSEKAFPGYYTVMLDDYNVKAELTSTNRVGFHRYTYPKSEEAKVFIDLAHRDPVIESSIKVVNDYEIEGFRRSKLWAGDQKVFFVVRFSEKIDKYILYGSDKEVVAMNSVSSKSVKTKLGFGNISELEVKVAISAVDIEGARKNMVAEAQDLSFNKAQERALEIWNKHLSKIEIEGGNQKEKRNFYTSYYHSLLTPNLFNDVDGRYRGMDDKIHVAEGYNHYTVFSLWDTFRALHPLLTITHPEESGDFVKSLIDKGKQFSEIPMWELSANDTRCMIGYHGVSVIADAYAKGIRNFDLEEAFKECVKSANVNKRGIDLYRKLGFVPSNRSSQSVSKTLEYAYDDWCIAQLAKALDKTKEYDYYMARSDFYKNIYNKDHQFMVGRDDSRGWDKEFDPMKVGYNYTEGNSFQYSLFVPHDIAGLIETVGGDEAFNKWLDKLFETEIDHDLEEGTDVTGLIGNYAHGNEPSHHLAYMYSYSGQPWKTQKRVRQIMDEMYMDTPGGICGNEDCGQMSAWYVMSAMGFYSVCPGSDKYIIGSPLFDKVTLNLDSGIKTVISKKQKKPKSVNTNEQNPAKMFYVKNILKDNEKWNKLYFNHNDIINGSKFEFQMSDKPCKELFSGSDIVNSSKSSEEYVSIPYVVGSEREFINNMVIDLVCDTKDSEIYYTIDCSEPDTSSELFRKPFIIDSDTKLKVRAFRKGFKSSIVVNECFKKSKPIKPGRSLKQGIKYRAYKGIYRSVYDWLIDTPCDEGVTDNINLNKRPGDEWFGMEFDGYIRIPADGKYTFWLNANDGCQLKIDGKELFESDGRKSFYLTQKYSINLCKGLHKIDVGYFQCSDRKKLDILWKGPGVIKQKISDSVLMN